MNENTTFKSQTNTIYIKTRLYPFSHKGVLVKKKKLQKYLGSVSF